MRLRTLILLVILAAIFPGLHHSWRRPRNLRICQSNLKNLSAALEMYSSCNGGRYPARLSELVSSGQLKAVPVCPEAGFSNYLYEVSDHPDQFTVGCRGRYHGEPSQAANREGWYERFYCTREAFPCYFPGCIFGLCPY